MKNSEHLKNIYLNLNIKRAKISYLSPLKDLFNLINILISTGSVLIGFLESEKDGKNIIKLPNKEYL
ncbi:hypothetical protein YYC_03886 [Plasmodium yoelii 17X]|uniref:Uncharacterized protein n=1 Tax=Plasmodium yoelii 17X TaxID=1323249 RepID=V7PGG0_PLAYE|nr:hypothetical protein YYC_03886 [Plasmodium yoelii 17X]